MKFLSTNGIQVGPFSEMKNLCLNIGFGRRGRQRILKSTFIQNSEFNLVLNFGSVFVSVTDGETQLKDTKRLYSVKYLSALCLRHRTQKKKKLRESRFYTSYVYKSKQTCLYCPCAIRILSKLSVKN